MSKKVFCFTLGTVVLALSFPAEAQQTTKIPRLGVLRASSPSAVPSRQDAFRQGLRKLGYVEDQNILIESLRDLFPASWGVKCSRERVYS